MNDAGVDLVAGSIRYCFMPAFGEVKAYMLMILLVGSLMISMQKIYSSKERHLQ